MLSMRSVCLACANALTHLRITRVGTPHSVCLACVNALTHLRITRVSTRSTDACSTLSGSLMTRIRQHTSAYASIRQHTSADVSIRQHTSACVSIRQHTSAYVRMRQHASACVSIRRHTPAYVSIQLTFFLLAVIRHLFDGGQRVGLVAETEDEAAYLKKREKRVRSVCIEV